MERTIEHFVDNVLEGMSTQLYIFSIGAGIVFLMVGIIVLLLKNKQKEASTAGMICFAGGVLGIISGVLHLFI